MGRVDSDEVWMQIKRQTLKVEWVWEAHGWAVAHEMVFLCHCERKETAGDPTCDCLTGHSTVLERETVTGGKGQEPRFVCEATQDIYPTLTVDQWCANLDVAPLWILPLLLPPGCPCFPLHTFIWGPVKIVLMIMHVHLHFGNGDCILQFYSLIPNTGRDKGLLSWPLSHTLMCAFRKTLEDGQSQE